MQVGGSGVGAVWEVWSHHAGKATATKAAWATWRKVQAVTVALCQPCHTWLEAERTAGGALPFALDLHPEGVNTRRGRCRCSLCRSVPK